MNGSLRRSRIALRPSIGAIPEKVSWSWMSRNSRLCTFSTPEFLSFSVFSWSYPRGRPSVHAGFGEGVGLESWVSCLTTSPRLDVGCLHLSGPNRGVWLRLYPVVCCLRVKKRSPQIWLFAFIFQERQLWLRCRRDKWPMSKGFSWLNFA